jgi:hypothetical protein
LDPIYQIEILKQIRKTLIDTNHIYTLTLQFTENSLFQDRIQYRLNDFLNTFYAYTSYRDVKKISKSDYLYLQEVIYKDFVLKDFMSKKKINKVIPLEFKTFFDKICQDDVIIELFNFCFDYVNVLTNYGNKIPIPSSNDKIDIVPMISYLVTKFYSVDKEKGFYDYILKLICAQDVMFSPSVNYYSKKYEMEFSKYLVLQNYDSKFIINLFGLCQKIEEHASYTRLHFFSFLKNPEISTPISSYSIEKFYLDSMKKSSHVTKKKVTSSISKKKVTSQNIPKTKVTSVKQKMKQFNKINEKENNVEEQQQDLVIDNDNHEYDLKELGLDDDDDEIEENDNSEYEED